MNIKSRLEKLEDAAGINKVNVANELQRLKALRLAGKSPPRRTPEDYKRLIADCEDKALIKLYQAAIYAIT